MKTFLNILRIIGAFILSLFLIIVLFCAPLLYSVSAFIQKDTVEEIIKSVDIVEILETDESFINDLNNSGISVEILEDFFNTKAIDEVIEVYVDDLFSILEGEISNNFTEEKLKEIANHHMNELIPIFRNLVLSQDDLIQISDEILKEDIIQLFTDLKDSLPNVEELMNSEDLETQEMIESIQILRNSTIVFPLIILAIILSVLILLCRWTKLEGLIWLAVDYIFPCGITFMLANSLKSANDMIVTDLPEELMNVMISAFSVFADKLNACAFILGGCAIIFIGIFIIFHNYKKRNEELEMKL